MNQQILEPTTVEDSQESASENTLTADEQKLAVCLSSIFRKRPVSIHDVEKAEAISKSIGESTGPMYHQTIALVEIAGSGGNILSIEDIESKALKLGLRQSLFDRHAGTEKEQRELSISRYFFMRLKMAAYKNILLDLLEGETPQAQEVGETVESIKAKLLGLGLTNKYLDDFEEKYTPHKNDPSEYYDLIDVGFGKYNITHITNLCSLSLFMKDFIIETGIGYFRLLDIAKKRFQEETKNAPETYNFIEQLGSENGDLLIGYLYIVPENSHDKKETLRRIFGEQNGVLAPQIIYDLCDSTIVENPRK